MSQIAKFDRQAMNQQLKRCGQLLRELKFIDMYIRLDTNDEARVNMTNPANGRLENLPVPDCYKEEVNILRDLLGESGKDDFSLTFEEMRLRVARRRMANGEQWVAMRRVADSDLSMEALKFDPDLIPYFSKMGARDGLILIAGATGHGKTTTANCLLSHYLKQYGKVAYTVEDPAEYNLHGKHGENGYCFQTEVDDEHGWADALKSALRWHPKYILVGEIRSPDAAAQVLRAATSGHLVITTVHAGSVEKTLHGMIQISSQALGDRAAQLLGDGLSCVIHQTLGSTGPQMRTLFTNPRRSGDGIRSHIREQKIHMLATEMDQQAARLSQGIPLFSAPPRRVS